MLESPKHVATISRYLVAGSGGWIYYSLRATTVTSRLQSWLPGAARGSDHEDVAPAGQQASGPQTDQTSGLTAELPVSLETSPHHPNTEESRGSGLLCSLLFKIITGGRWGDLYFLGKVGKVTDFYLVRVYY